MVKTRSSEVPQKRSRPKYKQIVKARQSIKKRKRQPKESQQNCEFNPDTLIYKTLMVPFEEQSFHPEQYLAELASIHSSDQDFTNLEIIEIMEHKTDTEDNSYEKQEANAAEVASHTSTQNKINNSETKQRMNDFDSQFGFTMEANKMNPTEFRNYCENYDISSCNSEDIQIEFKIESKRHQNGLRQINQNVYFPNNEKVEDVNPDRQLPAGQQVIEQLQNIQIMAEPMDIQIAPADNQIPFGPPNIDDLSTNYSLNHSQQPREQRVELVRHIFIQQEQNIFENLSEVSTKPCMSHVDQEALDTDILTYPSEDDYNELFWEIEQNEQLIALSPEEMHVKLTNYLEIMTKNLSREIAKALTRAQWREFWILIYTIHLNLRDQICISWMVHFVKNFQEGNYEERQHFRMEYTVIKERLHSLKMVCRHYKDESTANINRILNEQHFE